jgi:hypothetical protein
MTPTNRLMQRYAGGLVAMACALIFAMGLAGVQAQSLPEDDGRYSMIPVEDGVLRLDTHTGALSLCQSEDGAWACKPIADGTPAHDATAADTARQIEALRAEIRQLREQIGQGKSSSERLGDAPRAGPPYSDSLPRTPGRDRGDLPSEDDVDRMMDLMERFIERFRGLMERLENENRPPI